MEELRPIEASETHKKLGYLHDCPKCGYAIGYKEKRHGSIPRWMRRTVLYEECCQYCTFCGQKLDWSPDFRKNEVKDDNTSE